MQCQLLWAEHFQMPHGTNPASAVMVGMKVVGISCDEEGNIDLAPETYMKGYSVSKTLEGQGFQVIMCACKFQLKSKLMTIKDSL